MKKILIAIFGVLFLSASAFAFDAPWTNGGKITRDNWHLFEIQVTDRYGDVIMISPYHEDTDGTITGIGVSGEGGNKIVMTWAVNLTYVWFTDENGQLQRMTWEERHGSSIALGIQFKIVAKGGLTSEALLKMARENYVKNKTMTMSSNDNRRLLDTNKSLFAQLTKISNENAQLNKELDDRKAERYKIGFVTMEPIKMPKFKKPVIKSSFWKRLFQ